MSEWAGCSAASGERAAAGRQQRERAPEAEGDAAHGEERDDVLVEGAVVFELVSEVENDVGLELLKFLLDEVEVVEKRASGDTTG